MHYQTASQGCCYDATTLTLVAVQCSASGTRQRFTIAHENGHFMLHKDVYIDTRDPH